jgi:hypothetical protein
MVRVDGRVSEAVVTNVDTEVEGTIGMLFIDLDAPISELAHWKSGHRLRAWKRDGSRSISLFRFIRR